MRGLKTIILTAALVLWTNLSRAQSSSQAQQFQTGIHLMETKGDYAGAIQLFEEVSKGQDRSLSARGLFYLGLCFEKTGKEIARTKYRKLIDQFADQTTVAAEARARLAALEAETAPNTGLVFRRLHEWSEPSTTGVPSPDGRYLSFVDSDLYLPSLLDLATGETRFLTRAVTKSEGEREYALDSVFSPDGQEIAYGFFTQDRVAELRLIQTDGSNGRTLYSDPNIRWLYTEDWSSDGKHILATVRWTSQGGAKGNQLVIFDTADGSMRVLKTFDWRLPRKAKFSPDAHSVVYDYPPQEGSPQRDLFMLVVDDLAETPIVEHPANDLLLGWTPDGRQVWFASDRTGSMDLWALPVVGAKAQGAPELLKRDVGRIAPMAFTKRGSFFYGLRTGLHDIRVATLDPATGLPVSQPTSLSHRWVGSHRTAAWSKDGRKLAYISDRDEEYRGFATRFLIIRDVETSEERELWPRMNSLNYLRLSWSADGRSILATGYDHKQRAGIFRIDAQTGALTTLHSELNSWFFQAEWTPDEAALVYNVHDYDNKNFRIMRREVASGAERELYRTSLSNWTHFDLSPDGRWIVYCAVDRATREMVLKIAAADTGDTRELYRLPKPDYALDYAWSPDGRYVHFARIKSGGEEALTQLWRIPFEGGEPQNLGLTMDLMPHISFSPDGRKVAFTGGRLYKGEVWVMENFVAPAETTRAAASNNGRE